MGNNLNKKILTRRYFLALIIIALFNVFQYVIPKISIQEEAQDATLINMAGRQRMYSERISRGIIQLTIPNNNSKNPTDEITAFKKYLLNTIHDWNKEYFEIKKVINESTIGSEHEKIKFIFKSIDVTRNNIISNLLSILKLNTQQLIDLNWKSDNVQRLLKQSENYRSEMDKIVSLLVKEIHGHVKLLDNILVLMIITEVIILIIIGFYIFRPMVNRIQKGYEELQQINSKLNSNIFERKNTEIALKKILKENSDIQRSIDEHSIVVITDDKGKITYVNDKFIALSKYSREELIGKDHRIINSGYHSKAFFRTLWSTIQSGKVWKGIIKNKAKDNSYYWVDTTITPFLDENGKPYQYIAIRTDITQLKNTENSLGERENNLKLAQQIAHFGSWEWDIDTNNMTWSDELYRILNYSPKNIIADYGSFLNRVHIDDRKEVMAVTNKAISSAQSYKIEHRIVLEDKSIRYVRNQGVVYFTDSGVKIIGAILDITDLIKLSKELELFQLMIEKSGDPVFLIDDDDNCKMIYVNEAAEKHYGASKEEILTWHIPDWDPNFSYDQLPQHVEEVKKIKNLIIESQHRVAGNKIVPVEISLNYILYKNRSCHFGYIKNISDRKQTEQQLHEQLIELQQFNRVAIGRELKMIDLKKEINDLLEVSGKPSKYKIIEN